MWETKKVFAVTLHHAQQVVLWKNYSITWGRTSSFLTAATKALHINTRKNQEGRRATTHHGEPSSFQHYLHDTCLLHSQAVANVRAGHPASFGLARSFAPGGCPVAAPGLVGSPAGNFPYGSCISEYKISRGQPDRGAPNGDSGDTLVDSNPDAHRTSAAAALQQLPLRGAALARSNPWGGLQRESPPQASANVASTTEQRHTKASDTVPRREAGAETPQMASGPYAPRSSDPLLQSQSAQERLVVMGREHLFSFANGIHTRLALKGNG